MKRPFQNVSYEIHKAEEHANLKAISKDKADLCIPDDWCRLKEITIQYCLLKSAIRGCLITPAFTNYFLPRFASTKPSFSQFFLCMCTHVCVCAHLPIYHLGTLLWSFSIEDFPNQRRCDIHGAQEALWEAP